MKVIEATGTGESMRCIWLCVLVVTACGSEVPSKRELKRDCLLITEYNQKRCERRNKPDQLVLSSSQTFFHSREVIALGVEDKLFTRARSFSLYNLTQDNLLMIDHEPIPETQTTYDTLALYEDTTVRINLYPWLQADDFVFGEENDLRIVANHRKRRHSKFSEKSVTIEDFNLVTTDPVAARVEDSIENQAERSEADIWISEYPSIQIANEAVSVQLGALNMINPSLGRTQ